MREGFDRENDDPGRCWRYENSCHFQFALIVEGYLFLRYVKDKLD